MNRDETERNLGQQPIADVLRESGLSAGDLVAASSENITYKMIARACKGRRLTPNIKKKICDALNNATGKGFSQQDLFNY